MRRAAWAALAAGLLLAAGLAWRRRRARARPGEDPEAAWRAANQRGTEAFQAGEVPAAASAFERALELTAALRDPRRAQAVCLTNLGAARRAQGRPADAEACFREALALREASLGPAHALTLALVTHLAELLRAEGRPGEAEPLYRRALTGRQASWEGSARELLSVLGPLAQLLLEGSQQERVEEALPLLRQAAALAEQVHGAEAPELAPYLDRLAVGLRRVGELDEAIAAAERAVALREALPPAHTDRVTGLVHLGLCLQDRGQRQAAADLYRAALGLLETQLGLLLEGGEGQAAALVRRRIVALKTRLDEVGAPT